MECGRTAFASSAALLLTMAVCAVFVHQDLWATFSFQNHFDVLNTDSYVNGKERMAEHPSGELWPSTSDMNNLQDFSWDYIHSPGLPITTQPYNASYKNPCWNEQDKLSCLPYFFIGGFAKCGTTELFSKLVFHPDIFKGRKENHWWTRSRFRNSKGSEYYRNIFAGAAKQIINNPELITVDATASTIWDNHNLFPKFGNTNISDPTILTAHLIHKQIPQAKWVVIVRNPVKRLYSDYLYFKKRHQKSRKEFHEITKQMVNKFNDCLQNPLLTHKHCVYADLGSAQDFLFRMRIGLYYVHLQTWLSAFPVDQLMVVRLEDYSQNATTVLQNIFDFLGVKHMPKDQIEVFIKGSKAKKRNKKSYVKHGEMLDKTKAMLTEFYRPYNVKLAALLGDDRFLYRD